MLSEQDLKSIFNASYDRTAWLQVLHAVFGVEHIDQLASPYPIPINKTFANKAEKFEQIGEVSGVRVGNADDMKLAIFEVQINPNTHLHRNRTELRNLVSREMRDYQGILAVYHDPARAQWRFSFISRLLRIAADGTLSTEETAPKRFTYLLGADMQVGTAVSRFVELASSCTTAGVSLDAVKAAFAVETLNKEFYDKLFAWYENAKKKVEFPNDEGANDYKSIALIRLLTRLLFVWFIREKELILGDLFDREKVQGLIDWDKPSSYYKAILQNLFFATLNRTINERKVRTRTKNKNTPNSTNYLVTNIYRYQDYFKDTTESKIKSLFPRHRF